MTTTPTTTPTSGAAIQRYKIGYHADEWGQRSSTPSGIPDASGSWVRYADHVTALAAGQATAAQAVVPQGWKLVPVGWQFYEDGKWWNGDDRNKDHRKNTEEARYPIRDVYAVEQPSVPEAEDLSSYGAQLLEENGRKVLSYWPYCAKCRKPFEFEKEEPFASCGCPGYTEWGDPRPASWVQPPAATKALEELGAATRGK